MLKNTAENERWFVLEDEDGDYVVSETLARWTHRGVRCLAGVALIGGTYLTVDSAYDIISNDSDISREAGYILSGPSMVAGGSLMLRRGESEEEYINSLEEV